MPVPERSEEVTVAAEERGARLDRVLAAHLAELSRSRHKALILAGHVAVDGATIRDPSYRVNAGNRIRLTVPPVADAEVAPENIPLDIVYEDDELLVINKPAGLVVHPATGNWSGTLVNALIAHAPSSGIGGEKRLASCTTLTSHRQSLAWPRPIGAHHALSRQFADHGPHRHAAPRLPRFVWDGRRPPRHHREADRRHPHARDRMVRVQTGSHRDRYWEVPERYRGINGSRLRACSHAA
jgi:23S rRNA pseudouridine1911/1915/1917 synthase